MLAWTWWTTSIATWVTSSKFYILLFEGKFKKYSLLRPRSTDQGRTLERIQNSVAVIQVATCSVQNSSPVTDLVRRMRLSKM
jgi:hypothetical protein